MSGSSGPSPKISSRISSSRRSRSFRLSATWSLSSSRSSRIVTLIAFVASSRLTDSRFARFSRLSSLRWILDLISCRPIVSRATAVASDVVGAAPLVTVHESIYLASFVATAEPELRKGLSSVFNKPLG